MLFAIVAVALAIVDRFVFIVSSCGLAAIALAGYLIPAARDNCRARLSLRSE
jgi:hypothetical protein